jgi:hypothetical protein
MKILTESENTLNGTIVTIKNDDLTYSVGVMQEDGSIEVKHPNVTAEGCISALAHYLNGEAYSRMKLAKLKSENK